MNSNIGPSKRNITKNTNPIPDIIMHPTRKAIIVPIEKAEDVRSELLQKGSLDKERKIKVIKDSSGQRTLEIPVRTDVKGYRTIEQDSPEIYERWQSLKERAKGSIPDEEIKYVPSSWQIIGDIIIVSIPPQIDHRKELIANTLLEMYPRCESVLRDLGIDGQFRQPKRELITGSKTETIHKENQCLLKLDVTKVMYSKGNLHEKKLMSKLGEGETVVDMFAGIGYFSIPMAVHANPTKIISIEINPQSYEYLCENIKLNELEDTVVPINGDCAEVTPEGVADRVIMGYVGTTHHYLEHGLKAIKKDGGILHYHETTPEDLIFERPISRIQDTALSLGRKVEIKDCRRIKKYSPGVWHVVVDAKVI